MKIGIEIHQRLDTNKLFCGCPSAQSDEGKPDLLMSRRLHPVVSEMGEIDEASMAEKSKDRVFEYQVFQKHDCLVEMDEEPPGRMNMEALRIGLQMAKELQATPVDEVQPMRKMVIDGSNTSGFQRTAIVALNGCLESSKGTIHITTIAIEEESAGIISNEEGKATYRLDRLGIPLIEITTDPDIKDGAHLFEVAEKIGMMLRATGKVARGLGTIRQDVNISTDGGARVEIKGAQDLKMLPQYLEIEVKRQTALVSVLAELRARKVLPISSKPIDATEIFKSSKAKIIEGGLKSGASVLAMNLPRHKGLLGREIQPGKRYGTELSDYSKRAGVKGIIHSDENLEKYPISQDELKKLAKKLDMGEQDSFVLVIAPKEQAETALSFVLERANMDFVPGETRRANPDATTTYLRPLPGKARMYPETDVPPIPITTDFLKSVEKGESLDEKRKRLEKILNKEMAGTMLKSRNLHLFEKLVASGADPTLAATTLENTLVSLRREGIELTDPEKTLGELFEEYKKGAFVKAAIPEMLKGMAKGARVEAVLKVYRLQRITGDMLDQLVKENYYDMTAIMQKFRLQVDPQEVAELVKKKK